MPPGVAHLDASIAFAAPEPRSVTLRLLDPDGRIVGDSTLQGPTGVRPQRVDHDATRPEGTVVSGVLYPDDFNEVSQTGDELEAFPCTYTIG